MTSFGKRGSVEAAFSPTADGEDEDASREGCEAFPYIIRVLRLALELFTFPAKMRLFMTTSKMITDEK